MSAPPGPSAQRRLGLLLDKRALNAIAHKLYDVFVRLQVHSNAIKGKIPSPWELGFALMLYSNRMDEMREQEAEESPFEYQPQPSSPPSVRLLYRLLAVCIATYSLSDQYTSETLLSAQALPPPVHKRVQAEQFLPGYAVIRDDPHGALLLCIRGSREAGDLLTNLSSDAESFLAGEAHQGIVKSARKLHAHLRPLLSLHLSDSIFNKNGLIIFGHSLGGAVASALTLLLRYKRPPPQEPLHVTSLLANARCYSFSPPPFLDRTLMNIVRKKKLPITSIVYSLDVVPRLSAATVDRLIQRLAAYDFSPHVTGAVSRLVRSVTQPVIGRGGADRLAKRAAEVKVDARTLASVSGALASVASTVLTERKMSRSISHDENLISRRKRDGFRHDQFKRRRRDGSNSRPFDRGERSRSSSDNRSKRRVRIREQDVQAVDDDRTRGRTRDSGNSKERNRDNSKDASDKRANDKHLSRDTSKKKSRSKDSDLSGSGDTSKNKDPAKTEFKELDSDKVRKESRDSQSDRSSHGSNERHQPDRKQSGKHRSKESDRDRDRDGKLERRNSAREGKLIRLNSLKETSRLSRQNSHREDASDSSQSSGKHAKRSRDADQSGGKRIARMFESSRRASESDLERRKRKDRMSASPLENGRSSSKRRIANGRHDSKSGGKESDAKDKDRDKESTENSSSMTSKSAWGNSVVNVMLRATQHLGNQVESNANRYSRRKSFSTSSTSVDNVSGPLRSSASAYSLSMSGTSMNMEDHTSTSNSGDVQPTELPEMFLAGEIWHLDRPHVRLPSDLNKAQSVTWPVPRFVKRRADDFMDIEVSRWMVQDHDTNLIFKELERML